mgnify:CR=1 FL=1
MLRLFKNKISKGIDFLRLIVYNVNVNFKTEVKHNGINDAQNQRTKRL